MTRLEDLLADLAAEGDQLEDLVAPLGAEGWRMPTPAPGWDVAHQVGHLAWTDETAVAAATDKQEWDARLVAATADPDGFVDAQAAAAASLPSDELLRRWRDARQALSTTLRELPADARIPWYGPPMRVTSMATARFMETWAHARDVAAALGVELPAHDRVRHVVHIGVRTRDFAFRTRGLDVPTDEFRVELRLPGGDELSYGPADAAQAVTGSAYDFALLVTQRVHRHDTDLTAAGPDAERWLDLAQAFAGPPGRGREAHRG